MPARLLRWIMFAALALPLSALAQQLPGTGAFGSGPGAEGHGWLVVGPDDSPALVHIPPRGLIDVGGERISGHGGTVRVAASLNSMPEAVAAQGRSVYLVFPRSGARRLVLRASVSPAPVGNLWDLDQRERLDAMPSLEAAGELAGLSATDLGLAALIAEGEPVRSRLMLMRQNRWVPVELPAGLPAGEMRLVGVPSGMGLLVGVGGVDVALWRGEADPAGDGRVRWERGAAVPAGTLLDPGNGPMWSMAGGLVFVVKAAGGLDLRVARRSGVYTLASIPGVGDRFAVSPLPQSGRVVIVWKPEKPDAPGPDGSPPASAAKGGEYAVREVSVYTGRILYDGPPAEAWPFSLLEFRLLALLLVAIVVGVLLFVLRPEPGDGAVLLPRGTALAEPWRRALAGAIDLTVSWLIVSPLMGVNLESMMYPVLGASLVPTILLVMAVGCAHCTLGEWVFGRSIGKAISACRVARVGLSGGAEPGNEPPTPPALREALVRNVVRWAVPPLGMAALGTPGGRHRGDVLARTAVVVVVEPEGDEAG